MRGNVITPWDFARRLAAGEDLAGIFADRRVRLVSPTGDAALASDSGDDRSVRFTISTAGAKRDGLSLSVDGWKIDDYARNPVVLWAHDDATPAIARAVATAVAGGVLRSTAIFAEREIHPLADTVFQLIRGRFLSACSVGFAPIRARMATDPARAGEVDVLEQELWEWSVVNVPADPEALVAGRSVGIDTGPIFDWAERTLDGGGAFAGVPRQRLEELRRNARMPASQSYRRAEAATSADRRQR